MKTLKNLTLLAASALLLASCSGAGSSKCPIADVPQAQYDSVSYAIGLSFGGMLKQSNIQALNYNEMLNAMKDVMDGKETKIKEEQIGQIIQAYMIKAEAAVGKIKEKEQADFLAKNKQEAGVVTTESGLQYKIEKEGTGAKPAVTDTVEVHYKGTLLDGTEFDSSYKNGEPVKFPLANVIKGWTEGIQYVGEGGKIKLWIPYELGYGQRAMGPNLPAYSTLIFEVELLKVMPAAPQKEEAAK